MKLRLSKYLLAFILLASQAHADYAGPWFWGRGEGVLAAQTDLQAALDAKVDENASITGATRTKITYDTKGLVTSGTNATTADINDSTNRRYVTDAQLSSIGTALQSVSADGTTIIGDGVGTPFALALGGTSDTQFIYNNGGILSSVNDLSYESGALWISINSLHYFKDNHSLAMQFDGSALSDIRSVAIQDTNGTMALLGGINNVSEFINDVGYLTGNETITLSGDVSGSGTTSISTTIANSAVTLAKQANVATSTVFYRKTAGTGAPEVQTLATLKSDLGLTGTNSGDQTITLTGNVTGSGTGSFAATIAADAVTFAKMQNITTDRLIGRDTASSGDPEEITISGGLEWTGSTGIQTSAFTGDATKTAGGTALTLATVNSNVGSFGSSTSIPTFTVNGKGLITAASGNAVIAPAGTLTGTTLASGVVTSSLTTVGTLAAGNATAIIDAATTSASGKVELATTAETDTGTDTVRAVTPDGLAGSYAGTKPLGLLVIAPTTALTTGDGKVYIRVPASYNGMNLVTAAAAVTTTSSSGTPTVQVARGRQSSPTSAHSYVDMLSTRITIDVSEYDSKDATAAAMIDTANDDLSTGDLLRIDIDTAGTGTAGLFVNLEFRLP